MCTTIPTVSFIVRPGRVRLSRRSASPSTCAPCASRAGAGSRSRRFQQCAFYGGVALWAIALFSPVDTLAEDLLSLHMAQHLLIAELGAPLILVGLRAPVIFFFLPKPAMVWLARRRTLRRVMRKLTTPLGAIATYAIVLYGWHFAPAFEAALHHPFVHALQHESFFVIAILVWIPALEPTRRRLRGELWKAGHIIGARLVGMFLGAAFIVMRTPAYDWYVGRTAQHGLKPARGPADRGRADDEPRRGDHPVRRRLLLLPLGPGPRPRGGGGGAYGSTSPRRIA